MPRWWYFLLLTLFVAGMATGRQVCAQETTPAVSPTPSPDAVPADDSGVREVRPMIFYAWDEKAKRHKAILGTSLEELQQLEALRDKPADEAGPQRFHFAAEGLSVSGNADNKRAELTITLGIETRDEDWLAVPLRLNGAILQAATFQGPGSHFIEYDDTTGHVAWIRPGAKGAKYRLELKLLAPLSQVGEESRLDVKLPRVTPIKMALTVATPSAQGAVSNGAQLTATVPEGEATRFDVQASSSDVRLAWQGTRQPTSMERPAAFDAVGKILVSIESPTRIAWDATFNITVQQGEISRVSVRLPPGATLVSDEPAIRPSMSDDSTTKPSAQLVDVEFERPLQKGASREVRLLCERLIPASGGQTLTDVEVGGFEVQGAAPQRGSVGLILGEAWRVDATPGANMLRDDALPDGFREAGVLGSDVYRYVSRANSLVVEVSPRRKKLTLSPTYILDVQSNRVTLDARLRYQVLGARTDACRVDLPGWEVETVELVQPGITVDVREPIDFDPFATEPLAINLPRTMRGEFEVRIRARHDLAVDAIDFSVPLPRPAADEREAATVVVQAANNLELRYQAKASRGLVPLDIPPPVQLARRQQPALVFQERLDELDATLAAELDVRTREISVAALTQAEIGGTSVNTRQWLEYVVRYEPLRNLTIEAPRWLQQYDGLQISLNDTVLPRTAISFVDGDEPDAAVVFMKVDLPQPMIGAFTCKIVHGVSMSRLAPGLDTALTLTVLTPRDEQAVLRQNRVEVMAEPNIRVQTTDKRWQIRDAQAPPSSPLVLDANGPAAQVELLTTYNESRLRRTTVAEKLWLQSWIAGRQRQERAVFQVLTNDSRIVINCPASMPHDRLVLVVEGIDVVPNWNAQRQLIIDLKSPTDAGTAAEKLGRHTVELWWPDASSASSSPVRLSAPEIEGAWVRQVYWHVVLPRERMSLTPPPGMTPEMVWSGPWWQSPRLAQPQLEDWSGGTKQSSPPVGHFGSGYRQYLYSSVGQPGEVRLATQNTALWMLGLSSIALAAALALVNLPAARHGGLLLVAGVLLLWLSLWWPTLGVLAAQCAALAVTVFVGTRLVESLLLRRRMARRPLGPVAVTSLSAAAVRWRRTVETNGEPSLSRPSTTATAAMSLPLASEGKS